MSCYIGCVVKKSEMKQVSRVKVEIRLDKELVQWLETKTEMIPRSALLRKWIEERAADEGYQVE